MNRWLIFSIVFLVSIVAVQATVDVTIRPIQDVINTDGEASFRLTISNPSDEDTFRLYYSGVEWDVPPESFSLGRNQAKTITVKARPLYVNPGQHGIPVTIKSTTTNQFKQVDLLVNVRTEEASEYLPSVGIALITPDSYLPSDPLNLTLILSNRNPLDLKNVTVNVDSEYFSFTEDVSLPPTTRTEVSRVTIEKVIQGPLPARTVPVVVSLVYKGRTVGNLQKGIEIERYDPEFKGYISEEKSFLKTVKTYAVMNAGNVAKEDTFNVPLPLFKGIFTSQKPKADVLKQEGKRYLSWTFTLEPGQEEEVIVTTNYRPFILILIILVLGGILYFVLRSPLSITKSAQVVETAEGGISMLKVMLIVKNITNKQISDVRLYDRVPSLADYYKEDHLGSLAPDKVVKSERKGTMLRWTVGTLEPFEERIVTYKIRTQLNILGGLVLPQAMGNLKSKSGRKRSTKSATFRLLHKQ